MNYLYIAGLVWLASLVPVNAMGEQDCLLLAWDEIEGTLTNSPDRGECGYEIEDWPDPSFLGMDVSDLLLTSSGVRTFRFKLDLSQLNINQAGGFTAFEWATVKERSVVKILVNWFGTRERVRGSAYIQGQFTQGTQLTTVLPGPPATTVFGQQQVLDLDSEIEIEINWLPTDPNESNGFLQLRINGAVAGYVKNINLGITGPSTFGVARYGYIEAIGTVPQGSLRFVPVNPTPISQHL